MLAPTMSEPSEFHYRIDPHSHPCAYKRDIAIFEIFECQLVSGIDTSACNWVTGMELGIVDYIL